MKIIQVVTLFTPDGAFGGPTRVALNQTRELIEQGHQVTLAGAALGYGSEQPTAVDGVPVTLFPARRAVPGTGFAGLTSPGLLTWFRKSCAAADMVHVHIARDLVTLPVAAWAVASDTPYVLQPHGMVDTPSNSLARVLDVLATRRILEHAQTILCLTELEETEVSRLSTRPLPTTIVPNGVPTAAVTADDAADPVEVLFLARLHRRKRPTIFVQAALELMADHPDVVFSVVGPDEGEGAAVGAQLLANGSPAGIRREGALDPGSTLNRLRESSIYVLPAVDEPFPMSVLEAMSVGRPVIITDTCGLAGLVQRTHSGLVVDHTVEALEVAIRTLLGDPALRRRMGRNAVAAVRDHYGMPAIAGQLAGVYEGARVG